MIVTAAVPFVEPIDACTENGPVVEPAWNRPVALMEFDAPVADQVNVCDGIALPNWSNAAGENGSEPLLPTEIDGGLTVMVVTVWLTVTAVVVLVVVRPP